MSASRKVLLYYAGYHEWATSRLVSAVQTHLTPEQIEADAGLFFRSVRGTLNHMYMADALWYHRLSSDPKVPPVNCGMESYWGKPPAAWEGYSQASHASVLLLKQSKLWRPLVTALTEIDDERVVSFLDTKGKVVEGSPVVPCLMHVFNHATHHRGQLHAAMTRFGIPEPFVLDMPAMPKTLFKL